ncbi:MlaD family protein [Zavarzinia sp. CC-PAN008]|uniref:MlaD family protein n=1 Tax=Zavarzinia sp. CC-PAN008 TaxID=3243332 RepID=UPI003F747CB7
METRAHHLLIGAFTLALIAGSFVFVLWLAGTSSRDATTRYQIYFYGAVDGLTRSSEVRYNGVPVGNVVDITLDRQSPNRVQVVISVDAQTPIRQDSVAQLQPQGITGVSFVQISSGSGSSPLLEAGPDGGMAEIVSKPSTLEQVITGAPELIRRANEVLDRINTVISDENVRSVSTTLASVAKVSETVASKSDEFARIIENADAATRDLAQATQRASRLIRSIEDALDLISRKIDGEFSTLLRDASATTRDFGRLAQGASALIADNRDGLKTFTVSGLDQFARFINEARQLVSTMERVASRLENDPARFFFGNDRPEFQAR